MHHSCSNVDVHSGSTHAYTMYYSYSLTNAHMHTVFRMRAHIHTHTRVLVQTNITGSGDKLWQYGSGFKALA